MVESEAAVAIVHARGEADSVLLIRRSERDGDPWSGHWSFPGGRRDPEDRDALHTALRELEEECGIRLGREQMQTALPQMAARRRQDPPLVVAPFLFRVEGEMPTVLDPSEAVEAMWVPMRVFLDPSRHRLMPVPGWPNTVRFPAIDLNAVPLWGFTYRLISDWLGLCPNIEGEQPGLMAARGVLEFLLSRGLALDQDWATLDAGAEHVNTASVRGQIPVTAVLQYCSAAEMLVPRVSWVEVRPEGIRLAGPSLEEYLIRASG